MAAGGGGLQRGPADKRLFRWAAVSGVVRGALVRSVLLGGLTVGYVSTVVGCDGDGQQALPPTSAGGGATGGAGEGGGGGAAGTGGAAASICAPATVPEPEGCVDIFIDARVMPDPEAWGGLGNGVARHPFWRDETGLHMAWVTYRKSTDHPYLVVGTFDPETGATLAIQTYDVFPEGSSPAVGSHDVAAGPGGVFALAVTDPEDPYAPPIEKIFVGQIEEPQLRAVWSPSWPMLEAGVFGVGWDGEAFATHFREQNAADVRLVRLDAWGNELATVSSAATMTSTWDEFCDWATDADSGRSWIVSTLTGGVWLSGHERDGTPLAGTEAEGGLKLTGQGAPPIYLEGWYPAVGTSGTQAMLGWHGHDTSEPYYESRFQLVDGASPAGDAIRLLEFEGWGAGRSRALARAGVDWWLGVDTSCGLESIVLNDASAASREVLIHVERPACYPSCDYETPSFPPFSQIAAAGWGNELWLGFSDSSNMSTGETQSRPYRMVRAKAGCRYLTAYEVDRLGQR